MTIAIATIPVLIPSASDGPAAMTVSDDRRRPSPTIYGEVIDGN